VLNNFDTQKGVGSSVVWGGYINFLGFLTPRHVRQAGDGKEREDQKLTIDE